MLVAVRAGVSERRVAVEDLFVVVVRIVDAAEALILTMAPVEVRIPVVGDRTEDLVSILVKGATIRETVAVDMVVNTK